MAGIVTSKMGPNSPFRTLDNLRRSREQRLADAITAFSGTMTFVGLHILWFGFWTIYNITSPHPFDKFPFGLLTLIVSLEAIFLSTLVISARTGPTRSGRCWPISSGTRC